MPRTPNQALHLTRPAKPGRAGELCRSALKATGGAKRMRGLAFRRHQWQRARGRALRYLRWLWASDPRWVTGRAVARRAVDRTPCSCWMCGNPRRFTGEVTRQELRAECRCEAPDAEPSAAADPGRM